MTVSITVSAMNAATAIFRPCDSLAAAMDGYSPERSGSDLLMQSAGLLIICHMREDTNEQPTNFTHDGIVEDRFIGRIDLTHSIVRTVTIAVKPAASVQSVRAAEPPRISRHRLFRLPSRVVRRLDFACTN